MDRNPLEGEKAARPGGGCRCVAVHSYDNMVCSGHDLLQSDANLFGNRAGALRHQLFLILFRINLEIISVKPVDNT